MNTEINTTETETSRTLRASLCSTLALGGAWYIYIYPNGTCRPLNPWTDSAHIADAGARLLFSAEASNLTAQDVQQAMEDEAARSEIADNLMENYHLLDEAEELLMDMAEDDADIGTGTDESSVADSAPCALVSLHVRHADGSMQEVERRTFTPRHAEHLESWHQLTRKHLHSDAALLNKLNAERAARRARKGCRLRRPFAFAARILRALGACCTTLLLCYIIGGGIYLCTQGALAIVRALFNL